MTQVAVERRPATGMTAPRITGETVLWLVLAVFITVVTIVPLLYTIDSAFYQETPFGLSPRRSLTAIVNVYTSARYLSYLGAALLLAGIVTTIALAMGILMAFLVARTDIRGGRALDIVIIMPLFLSPFTGLIAWIVLGSENTGFVNALLGAGAARLGFDLGPVINIWSYAGIVWVMSLFFTPFAYLFTVNNLRAMDSSLEEAARMNGATPLQAIMKVTVPIMTPAFFAAGLLIFVLSAEVYTIPGIIGSTTGFTTLPWQIYIDSTVAPLHRAHAAAAGTVMLWITVGGVIIQRRITRVAERFVTVGGKGQRAKPIALGRWRAPALAFVLAYGFCAVLLPLVALLVFSLMKYSSVSFSADLFTTKHYVDLFSIGNTRLALQNTLMLGLLSGAVCMVAGTLISYMEMRRKTVLASIVAFIGVLPVAVPGLVYGIGLLWTYLRTPIYGTVWILLLAYIAKFIPYAIVVSRSGILQINRELEESARMSGASSLTALRRITMPILKPTLAAIFFFVMLMSIKELSASVLLASQRGPVLSVLTWSYMESGNFQFAAAVGVVQSMIMVALVVITRLAFRVNLEKALAKG
ncbi:ABC transporter permease [Alsobacter ponti]|nr:iron ABC transporter permease [Alsobacter ponti]